MSYYDAAYSTRETIENTKYFTDVVINRNVPGALVECGVGAGSQLAAMGDIAKSGRWIYGFDSFEGIPLASVEDDVQPGVGANPNVPYTDKRELLKSSGITVHSKEVVRANLKRWTAHSDTIVLVKGWFQDTLAKYREVFQHLGGIALLRLDGDLYESTKVSLQHLFPLVSNRGIIIVDDWKLAGCRRACEEYFAYNPVCRICPPHGTEEDGPAYFIKRSIPALSHRHNVFSQNGEDGILRELLRRIGNNKHQRICAGQELDELDALPSPQPVADKSTGWVCEFGAWDGKECSNTFRLIRDEGYRGVYIEGRADYYELLLKTAEEYPNIHPIHTMVDYEGDNTLDNILSTTEIPTEFDVLSIDIDSYDYQVWQSVNRYTPKIVVVEINSSVSPLDWNHICGPGKEGTGFLPMMELGLSKNYTLICHTGNLVFVHNDYAHLFGDLLVPARECYRSAWIFNNRIQE
jgi:hypothetical protein